MHMSYTPEQLCVHMAKEGFVNHHQTFSVAFVQTVWETPCSRFFHVYELESRNQTYMYGMLQTDEDNNSNGGAVTVNSTVHYNS